jgi:nitrite reductase (NADH) large subunit
MSPSPRHHPRGPRRRASRRLVIVGHGPVGHRLCQLMTDRDRGWRVTIFGEEPAWAYDRIRLGELVRGAAPRDLELGDRRAYASRGIEVVTGDAVIAIDRDRRVVRSDGGRTLRYDALVLATGARARRPAIEGIDQAGVLTLRTADDALSLRELATAKDARAVVLGGGPLGVEAAAALRDAGAGVALLEASPRLLSRHLDESCAGALAAQLAARGIRVRTAVTVARIGRAGAGRLLLSFERGPCEVADVVVVAAGATPRDELARACGLEVAEAGGVIVDDQLRTSDPRILAVGDCARHRGVAYGLVGPGYEMARVARDTLAGRKAKFSSQRPSYRLDVPGLEVSILGAGCAGGRAVSHREKERGRSVALRGRRLEGACAVGPWHELYAVEDAITRGARVPARALERFRRGGLLLAQSPRSQPDSAIICRCAGVTRKAIAQAAIGGCSVRAIGVKTGAGELCGGCRPRIAEICGAAPPPPERGLRALALAALAACGLLLLAPAPLVALAGRARSLIAARLSPEATGFALLALCGLALALPIAKRWLPRRGARLALYRVVHAAIGVTAAGAVAVHTGMQLGANLNRLVMVSFLVLLGTGALLGALTSASRAPHPSLRALVAFAHTLVLWVLPALLGFHILIALHFS